MKRKGILFDLDGTLWEVTDITYTSVNEVARKYGVNNVSKETICGAFGFTKLECAKTYFPDLELNIALSLMEEIANLKIDKLNKIGGKLYPNLEETIVSLTKDYELFIVSNTSKNGYIEAFLNSSGLQKYFKDYIAASSLNITKADAIKLIISKYNLSKSVYVGDTIKDMVAATQAGISFVQAKYGYGKDLKTNFYINDLNELEKVLKDNKVM